MKKLRTVVSGAGRIGWKFHIPKLMANEGFELTGVCDPLEERLMEVKDSFSVKGYTDYINMLEIEKPELTVIASPTHMHMDQAIAAMKRGSDVFLDKPIAANLKDAETIVEAMKKTGRKLMMFQPHRASSQTLTLKKIIDSGVIGDVFMIKKSVSNFINRNDWQSLKKYGGGMLNNYGAHLIDVALHLAGSPAKDVSGYMNKIASAGNADDVVKVLIKTENDICIDIDINMAAAVQTPGTVVYGRCGSIISMKSEDVENENFYRARWFDPTKQAKVTASDSLAAEGRKYRTAEPVDWLTQDFPFDDTPPIAYYDKCYEFFTLNKQPFVPVAETLMVMRVIDKCKKYSEWD